MSEKDVIPPVSENPTFPAVPGHFGHGNYVHQEWTFIDTERENIDLHPDLGPDLNPGLGPLLQLKVWQPYLSETACICHLYHCAIGGNGKGRWSMQLPDGYPSMRADPFGYPRLSNEIEYQCGPETAMVRFAWGIVTGTWNHEAKNSMPLGYGGAYLPYSELVRDVSHQLIDGYNNANGIKNQVERYLNKTIGGRRL
jgi:hypothetical protein